MTSSYADILERIKAALDAARAVFANFTPGAIETEYKIGHDPVTEADRALDAVLRQNLLREGEGWLSRRPPTIPRVSTKNGSGSSILSMARGNSFRAFPSSVSRSASPRTASPWPEESTIRLPKKRSLGP